MAGIKGHSLELDDNSGTIAALRSGSDECFDAVYRTYFRVLCSFAMRYVTIDRAQEIVQDTMMWLWENRSTLIPEMSLRSLLFVIVKNKSLNRITHNQIKFRVHAELAEQVGRQFEYTDAYMSGELADKFAEALDKVPPEARTAFEMNRTQGMTHKQIAMILDVSAQTVNYRISQALKVLRRELKEYLL